MILLDSAEFLVICSHKGHPLLLDEKGLDFFVNRRFIVLDAAYLFGGYNGVLTEMDVALATTADGQIKTVTTVAYKNSHDL